MAPAAGMSSGRDFGQGLTTCPAAQCREWIRSHLAHPVDHVGRNDLAGGRRRDSGSLDPFQWQAGYARSARGKLSRMARAAPALFEFPATTTTAATSTTTA